MEVILEEHSKIEEDKWNFVWACMSMLLEDEDMWKFHLCNLIILVFYEGILSSVSFLCNILILLVFL